MEIDGEADEMQTVNEHTTRTRIKRVHSMDDMFDLAYNPATAGDDNGYVVYNSRRSKRSKAGNNRQLSASKNQVKSQPTTRVATQSSQKSTKSSAAKPAIKTTDTSIIDKIIDAVGSGTNVNTESKTSNEKVQPTTSHSSESSSSSATSQTTNGDTAGSSGSNTNNIEGLIRMNTAMCEKINNLSAAVLALTSEVQFLRSLLGLKANRPISDIAVDSLSTSAAVDSRDVSPPSECNDNDNVKAGCGRSMDSSGTSTRAVNYADAVIKSSRSSDLRVAQNNFREAIVAAVYVDKRKSENRANSFIVSGLEASTDCDDVDAVYELCAGELDIEVDITSCKRLGHPQPGKCQPLLVICKSSDVVADVLSYAKLLRNSENQFVKNHVFINPNLTKAEARAAYELRCQRRQRRDQLLQQQLQHQSAADDVPTSSKLNANASAWQPPTQQQQQQQQQQPAATSASQR